MENQPYLHLILLGTHFFLVFVSLFLLFRITKRILSKPITNTHHSALVLFLSFGITLLFFKDTANGLVKSIGRFIISPFEGIAFLSGMASEDPKYFYEWLKYVEHTFSLLIFNIDYVNIFIFFVFWLLTSMVFNEIGKSVSTESEAQNNGSVSAFTQTPIIKYLFTIFLVLFSIYLSVSSIIAVPEFQTLEASSALDATIVEQFDKELDNSRVVTLDKLLLKEDSIKVSSELTVRNLLNGLNTAIREYNIKANQFWASDENLKNTALSNFNSAFQEKMAPKERAIYKRRLLDWYSNNHNFVSATLLAHRAGLQTKKDEIDQFLSGYTIRDTIIGLDSAGFSGIDRFKIEINDFSYRLYYILDPTYYIASAPAKPQIGEQFGVFNTISGWLLRTESLSLALIVGLFGFGLLGAIGSTFIRKRTEAGNVLSTLSMAELQIILINGISAAIVIFLGVKGTVVVFTNSNKENLNPYVLFFTCLVASVFSEDVWAWARKKLNQNLGNDTGNAGPKKLENDEKKA